MNFEYDHIANAVKLKFKCSCGTDNETIYLGVPNPDFEAESIADSSSYEVYGHICSNCKKEYEITLYSDFTGGSGEINDEDIGDLSIDELYPDSYLEDIEFEIFKSSHDKIKRILTELENASLSPDILEELHKMLYANVCSIMELYLKEALIKYVLSSDEHKQKFVENYTDYKEDNFKLKLSEIYIKMKNIDVTIRKSLDDLIYHNLSKIKPMYKNIVGIDLGDLSFIFKAIQIRHDIVHRDGKKKDGSIVKVTKTDVEEFSEKVLDLMFKIESHI